MRFKVADELKHPQVELDPLLSHADCIKSPACEAMVKKNLGRLEPRYIGIDTPKSDQVIAAVLDCTNLDHPTYLKNLHKKVRWLVRQPAKHGYIAKRFDRRLHIPDIVDVHRSKETRSGGAMKPAYLRTVDELGGAPQQHYDAPEIKCPLHFDSWWGLFIPKPGYTQGDIVTDHQLVAYINYRRLGDYGFYSMIIGHGDYLADGVMYGLHSAVLEWALSDEVCGSSLKTLIYAGYNQGGAGLMSWKKKFLYEPRFLFMSDQKV